MDLDAAAASVVTVIAAYASREDRRVLLFWPLLFDNVTLRLPVSDDFPVTARRHAATDLGAAAGAGALTPVIGEILPLADGARAHELVDRGGRGRVLLDVRG